MDKLEKQIEFLIEADKLTNVFRQSYLNGGERFENSAEHSWHVSLMAMTLSEYADEEIDLLRVLKMLLIHDIVEIDAGDTFLYAKAGRVDLQEQEQRAAKRLFGLLPEPQAEEYCRIWKEFEEKRTPGARFAGAVDRLMPLLHNYYSQGKSWKEHNIRASQVLELNSVIASSSSRLWEYAEGVIRRSVEKGYLAE